jgi:hypothetical protein
MRDAMIRARGDSRNRQVTQDVRAEEANKANYCTWGGRTPSQHTGGRASRTVITHLGAGPVPEPNLASDNLHAQVLLFVCDRRQLVSIAGGVSSVPFSAATALHACRPFERLLVWALAPRIWELEQSHVDEIGGAAGF